MGVGRRGNKIVIDFRFYLPTGRKTRVVERKDVPQDPKVAKAKWRAIEYSLSQHGGYLPDYPKFFPHGSRLKDYENKSDMTLSQWWNEWLKTKAVKGATESNYDMRYRCWIGPYFGGWSIADISQHDILIFRKSMIAKKLSASTVNAYIKPLCQCLKAAHKNGYIKENPCDEMGYLSENRPEIHPLSMDELRHLLETWRKKDMAVYDMILFWSRTGLRPGELRALKWEHIDFYNKQVLIRGSVAYSGEVTTPKTQGSVREVDLRPDALNALKRQRERTGTQKSWVFVSNRGKRVHHTHLLNRFRHYFMIAGLPYRPPKVMRHTFATLHIAAGEQISWVSRMLGHVDVQTTLKKYNRFIPNLTREDGTAFERVFGNNGGTEAGKVLKL